MKKVGGDRQLCYGQEINRPLVAYWECANFAKCNIKHT